MMSGHTHDLCAARLPLAVLADPRIHNLTCVHVVQASGQFHTGDGHGRRRLLQRGPSPVHINAEIPHGLGLVVDVKSQCASQLDHELLRVSVPKVETSALKHESFEA